MQFDMVSGSRASAPLDEMLDVAGQMAQGTAQGGAEVADHEQQVAQQVSGRVDAIARQLWVVVVSGCLVRRYFRRGGLSAAAVLVVDSYMACAQSSAAKSSARILATT